MEYQLEDLEHPDIEGFISSFGYGGCHALSLFLSKKYNLDVAIMLSQPSGAPIHSFVILSADNELALDAHGITSIPVLENKYSHLVAEQEESEHSLEVLSFQEAQEMLGMWGGLEDNVLIVTEWENVCSLCDLEEMIGHQLKKHSKSAYKV